MDNDMEKVERIQSSDGEVESVSWRDPFLTHPPFSGTNMKTILIVSICAVMMMVPTSYAMMVVSDSRTTHREVPVLDQIVLPTSYNETSPEAVTDFLKNLPIPEGYDKPAMGFCTSRVRYVRAEAVAQNITLDEVTVMFVDDRNGHRVNTFVYGGIRYYTINAYLGDDRVVDCNEFQTVAYGVGIEICGFKDLDRFHPDGTRKYEW